MISMKIKVKVVFVVWAIGLVTFTVKAQHQISFQPVALNYFFDNSPFLSSGISGYANTPNYAYGVQYQYQKPNSKLIAAQFNLIREWNRWEIEGTNLTYGNSRRVKEANVVFSRQKQICNKVNWTYGAGPTVRNIYYVNDTLDDTTFPLIIKFYQSHDLQLGAKGQTSITYTPFKWLTLYSQFQFSGYLISRQIYGNINIDFINDFVQKQRLNFPSRFYSSLSFGVGINF
ncbi:MAG: hypothetical protein RL138_1477 [Bacteroidota bacterium]